MGTMVNPYIAGAPVTEAKMFFGREDVFQWIENSIAGQYADHILVIHGQRRVGKTSVLKQLGNRLPRRFIPVFFDLQGRTHTTLDRFLWWLAREIVRVLKQDRGIEVPLPEKESFASDLEYFEHRFLPDIQPALGSDTLLLTFDEFDNLEESEIKEGLARPLIDYLRRLMGNTGLNFIFSIGSSGRKLENMQAAYTEFFKTALYKKISFLNEDQTRSLITRPVESIIEYDKQAVTRIYQIAGGHPYFTQLTCHELFAKCQRTDQRIIKASDIDSVLEDVIERGTVNLKFVWDEASDIEKWSLAALAELEKTDNRSLTEYLRKHHVRFSESDLTSGLLHLREKDVLTPHNRFVIHLLRLWLQKNRPIEQARAELTEVNPIANRYIEIGLEFKDSRQYDKAIESFQEALNVAKDNLQAQVSIALVYMDQKMYDKAVLEFEKGLAMDDEDVSARSGLCEAHLALGDAAMTRGRAKEATLSYQRVLAINAEHTEARQRMAELSRQRAEKALVDGKEEESLSMFAEALNYTPEDPTLIERVNKVRAEKKARELAALLAQSEREAGAKNWEGAIKRLREALSLAPDDASIQKKIGEVKAAQEKAQLDALFAKADAAVGSGRWDEAIETLTSILSAKPDQAVEMKLAEVRAEQRDARLSELKARARGLARSEWFDEALSAWEEYLALEPADREKAQAEIEEAKKAQGLAESYAEAQRAYAEKNYNQAVSLLKGIINQDENYKDASRLLAQAIERRRTAHKWWEGKRVWTILIISASTALVLLAMVLLLNSDALGSIVTPLHAWVSSSNISPAPLGTEVATTTQATTEVTTSTSAEQIRAFADPILAAVAKRSAPIVNEDFSQTSNGWPIGSSAFGDKWGFTDEKYSIVVTNQHRNESGDPCLDLSPNQQLPLSDFVLEVEVQFISSGTQGNWHLLLSDMLPGLLGSENIQYSINFFADGTFLFAKGQDHNQTDIVKGLPPPAFAPGTGINRVTIISQGNGMAVYFAEVPLFLVHNAMRQDALRKLEFGVCNDAGKDSPLEVRFDNLKVWNLDGKDFSILEPSPPLTAEAALPTVTPTRTPGPTPTITPDPRILNPANQHLYLYVKLAKTWYEARDYCAAQDAHLVTIQAPSENLFVWNLAVDNNQKETWLGATDEAKEGTWVWVTGEPWNYWNWQPVDPSPAGRSRKHGDFLAFAYEQRTWQDAENALFTFVCEWEAEKDGMTLVFIPAGEFTMGSNNGNAGEEPVHQMYLDDFWIDQTEVTNAMYSKCVNAGACRRPSDLSSLTHTSCYGNSEFDNYPVIYTTWNMAKTYCEWAGRKLLTEAQWEKAARGTDGRTYPWGEGIDCEKANFHASCVGDTSRVGSYEVGKSRYGAYDMAGNVSEWVADWYGLSFYANSPLSNPLGPDSGQYRVLRSGSWSATVSLAARPIVTQAVLPLSTISSVFAVPAHLVL